MGKIESRLRAVERAAGPGEAERPGYVFFASQAEFEQAAGLAYPAKTYIGFGPDDWDLESEAEHEPG